VDEIGIPNTGQNYNSVDQDQVHRLKSNNRIEFLRDFRHNAGSPGGNGSLVVLLHGFPQRWREWCFIML
jgi:hypothetical protein